MTKNLKNDFDCFADFLFSDAFYEFESSPESILRFKIKLKEQLQRADKALKANWLSRAQKNRNQFEDSAKNIISELQKMYPSRQELLTAIQNLIGGNLQIQFRNRKIDELSDAELRGIIGDQKLLEILEKIKAMNE